MTTSQEFREFGVAMVNYIADYLDNIRDRPVVPKVDTIILHFLGSYEGLPRLPSPSTTSIGTTETGALEGCHARH